MLFNNIIASRKKLVLSIFGVTFASILNVCLGFLFQMLLAAYFGVGQQMDVYLMSSSVSSVLTIVLLSSLNITFIPVFIKYQVEDKENEAWMVVKGFLLLMSIFLSLICVVLMYFAGDILLLTNPGLVYGSDNYYLAIDLYYILTPSIVFTGIANLLRSIYQAHKKFVKSAWSPVLNSLILLGLTIILYNNFGIYAVAISTTVSSLVQCAFLIPILFISKKVNLKQAISHPGIKKILLLMVPWIISALFSKSNTMVDRFFASQFEDGSVSALGYAYRLMTALSLIINQGIAVLSFSAMSHYAANKDIDNLRSTASQSFRLILLVVIPSTVGIFILSDKIIHFIFQRGDFSQYATLMTSSALKGYLLAFVITTLGVIVTNCYYSLQDTLTPAIVGVIGFFVNIIVALLITPVLGFSGSALAYSVACTFNFIILLFLLARKIHGFEMRVVWTTLVKILIATLGSTIIWALGNYVTYNDFSIISFVKLITFFIIGVVVFVILAWLLKIPEMIYLASILRKRIVKE